MSKELELEIKELSKLLDTIPSSDPKWDKAYSRYCEISAIQHEEYKRNNIEPLRRFYKSHIEGKDKYTVDPEAWEWYSDYHKDVFGYRPKSFEFGV